MTIHKRSLALLLASSAAVAMGLWLERRSPFDSALAKSRASGKGSSIAVSEPRIASVSDAQKSVRLQKMGQMPLYFIENRGRLDPRVAFYVQGHDKTLYFTRKGITFALSGRKRREPSASGLLTKASFPSPKRGKEEPDRRWVVKLDFVGANPSPKITPGDRLPAVVSYFEGPRENWKAGLSTYGSIAYSDLWPGIDLIYSGTANRLKYSFLVKPGTDPARVRLAYRGASAVRLNDAGQLEAETPAGVLRDDKPYAYQEVEGRRVEVNAAYSLDRASAGGSRRYGFALGSYDRSKPLVLDPAVFVYAGYIGGSSTESGMGIAVDSSGNAYVTGATASTQATFPVTVGPDLTHGGTQDVFVAKINAAGTALVYAGYIGGAGDDRGHGIAVDAVGNAYIAGETGSDQTTFPVTIGPDLTYNGDSSDAFVAKVNPTGTALVYCGYIGGSRADVGNGIALDGSGNAYVTGFTVSTQATFPVTVGPVLTNNGGADAFVAKVNAAGTALVYCGFIGGSDAESANGIAVDVLGNAYVTGWTSSTEATFPVTVGPDMTYNGGNEDAFVAKVNAAGTALVYCGYIGGAGYDLGFGIAVDTSGNAYLTGVTNSTEATFPVTLGPDLTYNGYVGDAFVAKINPAGTALVYAGYIGGDGYDQGSGIAVDSSGDAYVTGDTSSDETTFPVTVGPDLTFNFGAYDGFVAKVDAAGTALIYSGYIGGSGGDFGNAIALDGSGNAYVTGETSSTEATFPITVGPDLTFNGQSDAFVVKIAGPPIPATSFYTLTPCRLLDTRDPAGPWGGPALSAGAVRTFVIAGRCSVPVTANAVSVNATVTQPTTLGHLVFFPGGSPQPLVSTINYRAGQTRANNAIVRLGADGTISVACGQASGTTHFILDINGYFQ